jgi:hypothetical protein
MSHNCIIEALRAPPPPSKIGFRRVWIWPEEGGRSPYWHYNPISDAEQDEESERLLEIYSRIMELPEDDEDVHWHFQQGPRVWYNDLEMEVNFNMDTVEALNMYRSMYGTSLDREIKKRNKHYQNYLSINLKKRLGI